MVKTTTKPRTRIRAASWPRQNLGLYRVLFHKSQKVILEEIKTLSLKSLNKAKPGLGKNFKMVTVGDARTKTELHFVNGTVSECFLLHQHLIPEEWKKFQLFFLGTTFCSTEKGQENTRWVRCLFWNKEKQIWVLQFAKLDKVFSLAHSKDEGTHKIATID